MPPLRLFVGAGTDTKSVRAVLSAGEGRPDGQFWDIVLITDICSRTRSSGTWLWTPLGLIVIKGVGGILRWGVVFLRGVDDSDMDWVWCLV